jgi:hypothetical protein
MAAYTRPRWSLAVSNAPTATKLNPHCWLEIHGVQDNANAIEYPLPEIEAWRSSVTTWRGLRRMRSNGEKLVEHRSTVCRIGGWGSLVAPPQSLRNACRGPVDVLEQERQRRRYSLLSVGHYHLGCGVEEKSRGPIFIVWARMSFAKPFQSSVQITEN